MGSQSQAAFSLSDSIRFVNQSVGRSSAASRRRYPGAIRSRRESALLYDRESPSTTHRRRSRNVGLRDLPSGDIILIPALMSGMPQLAYAIIRHDSQKRLVLLVVACAMGRRGRRCTDFAAVIGSRASIDSPAFGSTDSSV